MHGTVYLGMKLIFKELPNGQWSATVDGVDIGTFESHGAALIAAKRVAQKATDVVYVG